MEKPKVAAALTDRGPDSPAGRLHDSTNIRYPMGGGIQRSGDGAIAVPLADKQTWIEKIGNFKLTDGSLEPKRILFVRIVLFSLEGS